MIFWKFFHVILFSRGGSMQGEIEMNVGNRRWGRGVIEMNIRKLGNLDLGWRGN